MEVGQLKDISEDFNLGNIVIRSDFKVQLRFANFKEAYAAYYALLKANMFSSFEDNLNVLYGQKNDHHLTEFDQRYNKRLEELRL